MIDVIKIRTKHLRFSTTVGLKRASLGDSNGPPEMAAETNNTYISETKKDSIDIPTDSQK